MRAVRRAFLPAAMLMLFAADASAWGLYTHVFLAQHLLLALPFADPQFRRAALRLPRLVLAGACLPDLALAGIALRTRVFHRSHIWPTMRRFLAARSDEERAIGLGYASHLLADVIAHNHFVPEHETRIADVPHATHALCEWAMDAYLRKTVLAAPEELLDAESATLAGAVARHLRCPETLVRNAILMLASGTRLLRASRVPRLCRTIVWRLDRFAALRFDAYMRETVSRMGQLGEALAGVAPQEEPEPSGRLAPCAPFSAGRLARPPGLS
jgi:hypothetical protein